jgi:starch synthase
MVAMEAADRWPDIGRLILLNENLGGHATMHLHMYRALAEHPEIDLVALNLPPRSFSRRLVGVRFPGLSRVDLDLAPIRAQLALSVTANRMLREAIAAGPVGAIHAYSQHAVLRSTTELRAYPSVVSTDGSAAQNSV